MKEIIPSFGRLRPLQGGNLARVADLNTMERGRRSAGAPVAEVDVPVVLERKAALVAVRADGVHAGQALAKVGVHRRAEDLPQHSTLTLTKSGLPVHTIWIGRVNKAGFPGSCATT